MNTIKDGGPAFPESASGPYPNGEIVLGRPGMSLRDYFAGMALSSMDYGWFGRSTRIQEMASESYAIADAMLAAREGKEEK